jgi:hypothetical protein
MNMIQNFMDWWNSLASRNGKLKFGSQREAADFVRRVQNEQGGPNEKMMAIRKRYNEVARAKKAKEADQLRGHRNTALS